MNSLNSGVGSPPEQRDGKEVKAFFSIVYARRWIVLATLAVFILASLVITLLTPKKYATEAKLLTGQATGSSSTSADVKSPVLDALIAANGQSPETYSDLIQQTPIAQRVRDNLKLSVGPDSLLGHLAVKPLTNTSIITVTADWNDAATAAAIANEFVKVFVDRERELISSQAASSIDFLSKELPGAENRMHQANAALARFSASHGIIDINSQTQGIIVQLAANDSKVAQTQLELKHARAQLAIDGIELGKYESAGNGGQTTIPNPIAAQLQNQLATVTVQLATMRREYTDNYVGVQNLISQKQQLETEIATLPVRVVASENVVPNPVHAQLESQIAQLTSQIAASNADLVELRRQRGALQPQIANLPATTARLVDLQHEAKSAQDVYNALQQKYQEAAVLRTTAPSDVQITQPASADRAKVTPDLMLNLVIGTVIGLIVSLGAAFSINFFDSTLKNEADIADRLQLPTLGAIPVVARTDAKGESYNRLRNITIESFLQLATSLRYSSDGPLKTITFVSPASGDGKSTIALNAAIAMGELEPPVLIIDCDFRQPRLHSMLNLRNGVGLSDLLVGRVRLDEVIHRTSNPGVDFISSGTRAPNPVKLFRSNRMDELLAAAGRRYTCIIIDTPATDGYVDGVVLAAKTDGSVLVVSSNQTDMSAASKTVALLARFGVKNTLGVVLNRVNPKRIPQASAYRLESEKSDSALSLLS
ncbi:MAG: polysaccharide biosynthesis tyrosine autokinase [Candidatus Velthaea sp.]|jgi:capsular exopolysaccharide synthesis family protein